jgi:cation diffusion facilitator family transporter
LFRAALVFLSNGSVGLRTKQKITSEKVSLKSIFAAASANVAIALAKFIAAYFTGSSALLSEGIHSVVDTGNEVLLYIGIKRSEKPPDQVHPFGYGPEIYFWAFCVAILVFSVGGGLSFYEGISHLLHPSKIENPGWTFAVLGVSFVFESVSLWVGLKEFWRRRRHASRGDAANNRNIDKSLFGGLRASKDPSVFAVVIEDMAALFGLLIALFGVGASVWLNDPRFDGAASVVIGLMLMLVAIVMMIETRDLIIGESADEDIVCTVREIVINDVCVKEVSRILTMHLAPYEVLLTIDLHFADSLSILEVRESLARIERNIKDRFQMIQRIYIDSSAIKN